MCKSFGVEAVLVSISKETQSSEHFENFFKDGIPVIFFDKAIKNEKLPRVYIQDEAASYKAVSHLLEKKHLPIVGIFDDANLEISQLRYQGFQKAQMDFGINPSEDYSFFSKNLEEARHVFRSFLKAHPETKALFAMSDELLAVAMEVIYEMDKKVPEDIAVVCISNGHLPYYLKPKITHIHHSGYEVGKKAVALMFELLRDEKTKVEREMIVETRLVKLDSV